MLSIIRADLFRIFRSKGIYITIGALLVLMILHLSGDLTRNIGIWIEPTDLIKDTVFTSDPVVSHSVNNPQILTGFDAARRALFSVKDLFPFFLTIIIFVCGADFSSNTIKIIIASGKSRTRHYFAKLILSVLASLSLVLVFVTGIGLVYTTINGFGTSTADQWSLFIRSLLSQLFFIAGVAAFGAFLSFVTQKASLIMGFLMAYYLLPALVLFAIFGQSDADMGMITSLDVSFVLTKLAYIDAFPVKEVLGAFAHGTILLIGGTAAGLALFSKSDIK